jgi:hypothetical protein
MVRLVVLQESRMTASATAPPAPHNTVSRLPRIHRVSLECHTNREYAQKEKILTTHFFGFFLGDAQDSTDAGGALLWPHDISSAIYPKMF